MGAALFVNKQSNVGICWDTASFQFEDETAIVLNRKLATSNREHAGIRVVSRRYQVDFVIGPIGRREDDILPHANSRNRPLDLPLPAPT
jgi:hypothetical protein